MYNELADMLMPTFNIIYVPDDSTWQDIQSWLIEAGNSIEHVRQWIMRGRGVGYGQIFCDGLVSEFGTRRVKC